MIVSFFYESYLGEDYQNGIIHKYIYTNTVYTVYIYMDSL